MKKISGRVLAAVLVGGLLLLAAPARSSTPTESTLDRDHLEVRWDGTTTAQWAGVVSGNGCVLALPDPTCDLHTLHVGELDAPAPAEPTDRPGNGWGPGGKKHQPDPAPVEEGPQDLLISVVGTPAPIGSTDLGLVLTAGIGEMDVYLYDSAGTELARDTEIGRAEITYRDIPPGDYTVAVQSELSTDPNSPYKALAKVIDAGDQPPVDQESLCGLEGTGIDPATDPTGTAMIAGDPTAALDGVDTGEAISLDVLVLLEGATAGIEGVPDAPAVTPEQAAQIFLVAAGSYEPLNVQLRMASTQAVPSFETTDGLEIIRRAKTLVDSETRATYDIVEVLTNQDIQQIGQQAIAGIADCIGGVAHDDRAFLVAEARTPQDIAIGPVIFDADAQAHVTAHEIGHLMGGQHHYANCVEGVQTTDVREDGTIEASPCTLMFNAADVIGENFDTLNSTIVRGHAWRYAR